jgi:hypothetical protein
LHARRCRSVVFTIPIITDRSVVSSNLFVSLDHIEVFLGKSHDLIGSSSANLGGYDLPIIGIFTVGFNRLYIPLRKF